MSTPKILLIAFCCICLLKASAQPILQADQTKGCDTLTVHFNTSTAASSYNWNFGDGSSASTQSASKKFPTGRYTVTLTADGASSSQLIQIGKAPKASFIYNDTLDFGSYTIHFKGFVGDTLGAISSYSYKWYIKGALTDTSRAFYHQFDSNESFPTSLTISDAIGCGDSVSQSVAVRDTFLIPNVFTPNNDGQNDFFKIPTNGKTIVSLKVFTRAGVLVYATEAKILMWDGRTLAGNIAEPGIYFYVVETTGHAPYYKKSGFVYIYW